MKKKRMNTPDEIVVGKETRMTTGHHEVRKPLFNGWTKYVMWLFGLIFAAGGYVAILMSVCRDVEANQSVIRNNAVEIVNLKITAARTDTTLLSVERKMDNMSKKMDRLLERTQ